MALRGPVLLIEDDENDADVIIAAIKSIGTPNEIIHFKTAQEGYDYLKITADKPLLLLCDVRMSGLDGLSLLKNIMADEQLRLKAIPFVFLTGVATQNVIDGAFNLGVQGFYIKPADFVQLQDMVRIIITYWLSSQHPSGIFSGGGSSVGTSTVK